MNLEPYTQGEFTGTAYGLFRTYPKTSLHVILNDTKWSEGSV